MTDYPPEPFKQAESLLTGLIDSYKGSTHAADMADIGSLVETTVKIAQEREYRVQNTIKELSQKLVDAETEATYNDAKAMHSQRMADITQKMTNTQQDVQQVSDDIKGTTEQQAELQQQQQQLQAEAAHLSKLQAVMEPNLMKRMSLYAHITGLAFDYKTLGSPTVTGVLSDVTNGEIRNITVSTSDTAYQTANKLWDSLPCPTVCPAQQ